MTFDPKKHLIRVQGGREYLPVAARVLWFRGEHPDWGIATQAVEINMEKQYAIFSCSIFNAEGKLMATATKMENVRGFPDWLEKAETGSVGRALAYCGYGTQFAPDLDEQGDVVDAPARGQGQAGPPRSAQIGGDSSPLVCSAADCGFGLTQGQATMSQNKFGVMLCPGHQKSATPLAKAGAETKADPAVTEGAEWQSAFMSYMSALWDAKYPAKDREEAMGQFYLFYPDYPKDEMPTLDYLVSLTEFLWKQIDEKAGASKP